MLKKTKEEIKFLSRILERMKIEANKQDEIHEKYGIDLSEYRHEYMQVALDLLRQNLNQKNDRALIWWLFEPGSSKVLFYNENNKKGIDVSNPKDFIIDLLSENGDDKNGEMVLVFDEEKLTCFDNFTGLKKCNTMYLQNILRLQSSYYHPRYLAEKDESLKQVISYVIFKCKDKVFSYFRGNGSGETRLLGNRSIGIGSHVNPCDENSTTASFNLGSGVNRYLSAVAREIKEEVYTEETINAPARFMLNDNSNDVGRVHFGIVHICELNTESIEAKEDQLTNSGFVSINDLKCKHWNELEKWSQICIDHLYQEINR